MVVFVFNVDFLDFSFKFSIFLFRHSKKTSEKKISKKKNKENKNMMSKSE